MNSDERTVVRAKRVRRGLGLSNISSPPRADVGIWPVAGRHVSVPQDITGGCTRGAEDTWSAATMPRLALHACMEEAPAVSSPEARFGPVRWARRVSTASGYVVSSAVHADCYTSALGQ